MLLMCIQLAEFNKTRDSYFDVTASNAIEIIRADTKKTKDARAEDEEFIHRPLW